MATPNSLATTALQHLGVIDPGEGLDADSANTCLTALKSLLDAWNLDPLAVIGRQEITRTPSAGTKSFTVGTGGDVSSVRMPIRIESAFYRVNGVDTPVNVEPLERYLSEASKDVRGAPQFVSYEPGYSTGTVFMYPAADGVAELHLWILRDSVSGFASLTGTTSLTLPSGYQNALEWCLADEVSGAFQVKADRAMNAARRASLAKRRLKRGNTRISEMNMPVGVAGRGVFDINKG